MQLSCKGQQGACGWLEGFLLISQSNRTPASSDIFKNVLNMLRAEGDIHIIDHRDGRQRRTLGHWDNHILPKHQDIHVLH